MYIEDNWNITNDANNQISLDTTYSTQGSSSLKFELNGSTPEIRSNEFTIPSDGMYYIQYDMKVVQDKKYNQKIFSVYKDNAFKDIFIIMNRHSPQILMELLTTGENILLFLEILQLEIRYN